jgi:hypothetical protein
MRAAASVPVQAKHLTPMSHLHTPVRTLCLWGSLLVGMLLAACQPVEPVRPNTAPLKIGFFTPARVEPALVHTTHFGMVNAISPQQVAQSLQTAQGTSYQVILDLGPVLLELRDPPTPTPPASAIPSNSDQSVFTRYSSSKHRPRWPPHWRPTWT